MNTALFFGSFNPIHTGHLIIANTVLNEFPLSEVWFVVSPQNPLKENNSLLPADKRLMLVEKAIEADEQFKTCDVEFKLPIPSYTIDTLKYLEQSFPENTFQIIMGSDSFNDLDKWKDHETLATKNIIVYERPGFTIPANKISSNIKILRSPLLNISATEIRTLIKAGKRIKYLVPDIVAQIIEENSFYKL